jgi:hypothetical protein
MYEEKNKFKKKIEIVEEVPSRFIIHPKNFKKMWWDNFVLVSTIIYLFQLPFYVCRTSPLSWEHFMALSYFDFMFIIDSFLNLLVGFYDKDGEYEPKIVVVIIKNLSYGTILELVYYLSPIFLGI